MDACGSAGPDVGSARLPTPVRNFAPTPTSKAQPPVKGLTDNPAYQWWIRPNGLQPDSWWGDGQTAGSLRAQTDLMNDLGVRLLRVELPWLFVAPDMPGGSAYDPSLARDPSWSGYQWDRWDMIVRGAEAARIELVPEVVYAPGWATGVVPSLKGGPSHPILSTRYFGDFVHALVMRYHTSVHYWEMWNEPDLYPNTWTGSLQDYVDEILKPGSIAAKDVDPTAMVVMGGLATSNNMTAFYAAGAAPYFDIANFHAYYAAPSADSTALGFVRSAMHANGDDYKPVWMTEFGLPSHVPAAAGGPADPISQPNEEKQAALISGVFTDVRVQAIFFYQLRDTDVFDSRLSPVKLVYWGLVNRDMSRRKVAYDAFRRIAGGQLPPLSRYRGAGVQ